MWSTGGSINAGTRILGWAIESMGRSQSISDSIGVKPAGQSWRFIKTGILLLLFILSAGVLSLKIAGTHHSWAAWCTLLPLLAAIRILSPGKAMACGLLWGSSLFAFLALSPTPAIDISLKSFALLSAVPAIYALISSLVTRRFGFNPLILGFGWAGVEIALIPLGLQGGLLTAAPGYAAGSIPHLMHNLFGYVFMASLIAALNGGLLALGSHVCEVVSQLKRDVHYSAGSSWRIFHRETILCSFQPICTSRPRAPPVR